MLYTCQQPYPECYKAVCEQPTTLDHETAEQVYYFLEKLTMGLRCAVIGHYAAAKMCMTEALEA